MDKPIHSKKSLNIDDENNTNVNKQVNNYRYWEQTPLQRAVLLDPHLKRCLKRLQVLPVIKMIRPLYKNRTLLLNHKRRHSGIED